MAPLCKGSSAAGGEGLSKKNEKVTNNPSVFCLRQNPAPLAQGSRMASPDGEAVEERSDETDEEITRKHGCTLSPHPSANAATFPVRGRQKQQPSDFRGLFADLIDHSFTLIYR